MLDRHCVAALGPLETLEGCLKTCDLVGLAASIEDNSGKIGYPMLLAGGQLRLQGVKVLKAACSSGLCGRCP